jgi:hypothetical protein
LVRIQEVEPNNKQKRGLRPRFFAFYIIKIHALFIRYKAFGFTGFIPLSLVALIVYCYAYIFGCPRAKNTTKRLLGFVSWVMV